MVSRNSIILFQLPFGSMGRWTWIWPSSRRIWSLTRESTSRWLLTRPSSPRKRPTTSNSPLPRSPTRASNPPIKWYDGNRRYCSLVYILVFHITIHNILFIKIEKKINWLATWKKPTQHLHPAVSRHVCGRVLYQLNLHNAVFEEIALILKKNVKKLIDIHWH